MPDVCIRAGPVNPQTSNLYQGTGEPSQTLTQGNDGSPVQLIRYQFGNHLGSASLELDDRRRSSL